MHGNILTITLNPAIDKTVTVPCFKTGKTFREETLTLSAGGKGLNVSRVLTSLEIPTIASGFLGNRNDSYFKTQLKREGIPYAFTPVDGDIRTSLTVIDPFSDKITRILERGPRISQKELSAFLKNFLELIKSSSCVTFSGRNIPGAPPSLYGNLISIAKKKNVLTILDTNGKALKSSLKKGPFMIKPNRPEAEDILGEKLTSLSRIKKAVSRLHKYGIEIVAITLAAQGAVVSDGDHIFLAAPPKIKRTSPVGCGDSFIAGFFSFFVKKKRLAECIKMAVACGTANALSRNPGFINRKEVGRIFEKIALKRLD